MQLALVLALAFAVGITLFAVQNTTMVPISFFGLRADNVAVSLMLVIAALVGAALTFVLGLFREIKHRAQLHSLQSRLRVLERRSDELEGQLHQAALPPRSAEPIPALEQPEATGRPDL